MKNPVNTLNTMVEISKIISTSRDFFKIKDEVIDKMLSCIPSNRACVNLFINNDYDYSYLVCKKTLGKIPEYFNSTPTEIGEKISMEEFPDYIKEVVKTKEKYYVEDIFSNNLSKSEQPIAKKEHYNGRIVIPLLSENELNGFMTCFLDDDEKLSDDDIKFIESIATLLSMSIDSTSKKKEIDRILNNFRDNIQSLLEIQNIVYYQKGIENYLDFVKKDILRILRAKDCYIYLFNEKFGYTNEKKFNKDIEFLLINEFVKKNEKDEYYIFKEEEIPLNLKELGVETLLYFNIIKNNEKVGQIYLINSKLTTGYDIRIVGLYAFQVAIFIYMYLNHVKLFESSLIKRDLDMVRNQQDLITKNEILVKGKNAIADFLNIPLKIVGGDYCKYKQISDDKFLLFVADVMGHGLVSNYFVTLMKGVIKTMMNYESSPGKMMSKINSLLFNELDEIDMFITAKMIIFDFKNKKAIISNAGHSSPIAVYKEKNKNINYKIIKSKTSIPFGIKKHITYFENIISLEDILLISLYTDGIIESKNKNLEEFGIHRLGEVLIEEVKKNNKKPCLNVKKALDKFVGKETYKDDLTLFTLSMN